ncbi:MAG: hypothetical protein U9N55_10010, partial [candidate division Zixibacteria bacterium]|nr:hypothetical protein [candidate division Zixibacteria bacterium]
MHDVTLVIDTGGDTLSIQRPQHIIALADSLVGDNISGKPDSTVEMVVYGRNTVPINQITIPFDVNGTLDMDYDSFSTDGCITDYFENQNKIHSDSWLKQYTIQLLASSSGTSPELVPGDGPVIKLYFTVPSSAHSGQKDTVALGGYGSYEPYFSGSLLDYMPLTHNGTVSLNCCQNRGDADGGGVVNAGDISYLVAYLFLSGPQPPCETEGDADGGGAVNPGDVSYLVAYLFLSGPPPPPC